MEKGRKKRNPVSKGEEQRGRPWHENLLDPIKTELLCEKRKIATGKTCTPSYQRKAIDDKRK